MIKSFFRLLWQGMIEFKINPLATILTLSAVLMVSFLVGVFLMSAATIDKHLSAVKGEVAFQIYWKAGTPIETIETQWASFSEMPGFASITTYTPQDALKEMEKRLGSGQSSQQYAFLKVNNPLPYTALIRFIPEQEEYESWMQQTNTYLGQLKNIDRISSTPLNDEMGNAWRQVKNFIMRPLVVFMALLLGLVVGNTVRLSLMSKAQEVEILKLVGAYSWYIRLPLLVNGGLHGLIGSAIAVGFLKLIHGQIKNILNFPPLLMDIVFPSQEAIITMLIAATLTGILGGWFGMKK